jgi:hypothetical protein
MLFGCYRKGDANDPDTYTAAITAILAEYAPEVIQRATDPRTGMARKLKFLPTVAEVSEECEAAKSYLNAVASLARRGPVEKPKEIEVVRDPVRDAEMARKFQGLLAQLAAGMLGSVKSKGSAA